MWDRLSLVQKLIATAAYRSLNPKGVTLPELADLVPKTIVELVPLVRQLVDQNILIEDTDGNRGGVYCYTISQNFSGLC